MRVEPEIPANSKRCRRCGLVKERTTGFHQDNKRGASDGYRTICKDCRSERSGTAKRTPDEDARLAALERLADFHPTQFAALHRSERILHGLEGIEVEPPEYGWRQLVS